eukprot:gene11589-11733_t
MYSRLRIVLLLLVFNQLIAAVNILYDETGWTKVDWQKYKIDYSPQLETSPSEAVIRSDEIRKALEQSKINSLDGPVERTPFVRIPGLWSSEDGALVQSPDDDAVDAAAEAATCTVCHGLISHVWQQVVHAINTAEPINEGSVRDMFDEACEDQAGVAMFVVRERRPGASSTAPPAPVPGATDGAALGLVASSAAADPAGGGDVAGGTDAEVQAAHQACTSLVNQRMHSMMQQVWERALEYFIDSRNLAQKMLSKIKLDADDDDEYEQPAADEDDVELERTAMHHIPSHKLIPIEADTNWRSHPLAEKDLAATARTKLNVLRNAVCTGSKACLSGGSSSIPASPAASVEQTQELPGAILAKQSGFVLGKPFWNLPDTVPDPKPATGLQADSSDVADVMLMGEKLHNTLVSIRGMDGYFVYQLTYRRRVYQYHRDPKSSQITEEHVLGLYDDRATKAAAMRDEVAPLTEASVAWLDIMKQFPELAETPAAKIAQQMAALQKSASPTKGSDASDVEDSGSQAAAGGAAGTAQQQQGELPTAVKAPPFLDLLDYLPDKPSMADSWWPYKRHMYLEGEKCTHEGKGRARQVELRLACSPNKNWHMLVREPDFCRYIMVLYHPSMCTIQRYKPVPRPKGSSLDGKRKPSRSAASTAKVPSS